MDLSRLIAVKTVNRINEQSHTAPSQRHRNRVATTGGDRCCVTEERGEIPADQRASALINGRGCGIEQVKVIDLHLTDRVKLLTSTHVEDRTVSISDHCELRILLERRHQSLQINYQQRLSLVLRNGTQQARPVRIQPLW